MQRPEIRPVRAVRASLDAINAKSQLGRETAPRHHKSNRATFGALAGVRVEDPRNSKVKTPLLIKSAFEERLLAYARVF